MVLDGFSPPELATSNRKNIHNATSSHLSPLDCASLMAEMLKENIIAAIGSNIPDEFCDELTSHFLWID